METGKTIHFKAARSSRKFDNTAGLLGWTDATKRRSDIFVDWAATSLWNFEKKIFESQTVAIVREDETNLPNAVLLTNIAV